MKKQLWYLLTIILFGCFVQNTAYAQGTGFIDITLPECDKIDNDKLLTSPGEGDSKFVYKPVSNTKDSVASVTISHPTPTTSPASAAAKIRIEKAAPAPKETVSKQSKNVEEPAAKTKSQDDSILSFNFLYYIIEKYKLQDIVD